ncbi:MAG: hypothetical protein DSY37_00895, partial [Hyperthermus sp.]
RIPVPLPGIGHVNTYIVGDEEVWIIDPGFYTATAARSLFRSLKLHGVSPCSVRGVIATHFHVDHVTMTPLLGELASATLYMGRDDWRILENGVENFVSSVVEIYRWSGVPAGEAEVILRQHPAVRMLEAYNALLEYKWNTVTDGDLLRAGTVEFSVVAAPGHTPGHILLAVNNTVFTGDALLGDITPHILLHDLDADPLGDYMETLKRIERGFTGVLGLPGHREPIRDVAARAAQLRRHHEKRLHEIHGLLVREKFLTGYMAAKMVKWRTKHRSWSDYSPAEKFFAVGEALAHLKRLEVIGLAERVEKNGLVGWRPA